MKIPRQSACRVYLISYTILSFFATFFHIKNSSAWPSYLGMRRIFPWCMFPWLIIEKAAVKNCQSMDSFYPCVAFWYIFCVTTKMFLTLTILIWLKKTKVNWEYFNWSNWLTFMIACNLCQIRVWTSSSKICVSHS